jgi:hypothetical protein
LRVCCPGTFQLTPGTFPLDQTGFRVLGVYKGASFAAFDNQGQVFHFAVGQRHYVNIVVFAFVVVFAFGGRPPGRADFGKLRISLEGGHDAVDHWNHEKEEDRQGKAGNGNGGDEVAKFTGHDSGLFFGVHYFSSEA